MSNQEANNQGGLKKELGLFEATATGVGIILGAGIYVIIGKAAGLAGGAIWMSFLFGAIAAALTGVSYAELSSMFPRAAASFEYTNRAFGLKSAFVVGWLFILSNILSAAAVSLGFGGYILSFTGIAIIPTAVILIMLCMGLLVIGVKETVRVGVLFTALEVIGLIIVIVVSIRFLGSVDYLETPSGLGGIFQATTLLFFAYLGFEQIANLSEESKNPSKHIPLAIIFSVIISTVLYVAVALASVSVVGWQALSESGAPLAQVVQAATGARAGQIVAIIALFATANTTLFLLLTASRMMYGMSGSAVLPTIFSALHPKRRTPWVATLVAGGIAVAFTMIGDIGVVAQLTNFAILVAFVMVNASLIWLRRTRPEVERRFRVPLSIGWIPVPPLLGIGVSLFMIANIEPMGLIIGAIIALAGLPVLFLSRRFGRAGAVAVQAEQD